MPFTTTHSRESILYSTLVDNMCWSIIGGLRYTIKYYYNDCYCFLIMQYNCDIATHSQLDRKLCLEYLGTLDETIHCNDGTILVVP